MITICTVILDTLEKRFLDFFLNSVLAQTSLVREVLLAKADAKSDFAETWDSNGITFHKFGYKQIDYNQDFHSCGIQHALGLHECINRASEPFIMLSDPDIFFYKGTDEFYLSLMEKFNLNIIGCSHYNPTGWAVTFFPNQVNLIVKKNDLPDGNFLKEELKIRDYYLKNAKIETPIEICLDGKYLIPGCIPSIAESFPNPNGLFETGCNLWHWAKLKEWKWLSFQTTDCHSYKSLYNRGSIKPGKLEKRDLIYHCGMTSVFLEDRYNKFKESYEDSLNEEEEE